ncbi:hypothetical protein LZ31DRAFT_260099 [Colletotrichum somersetense]|nr:hypothetical protein LZ31DRAFT_260099 [Colletotrichum somersetense]
MTSLMSPPAPRLSIAVRATISITSSVSRRVSGSDARAMLSTGRRPARRPWRYSSGGDDPRNADHCHRDELSLSDCDTMVHRRLYPGRRAPADIGSRRRGRRHPRGSLGAVASEPFEYVYPLGIWAAVGDDAVAGRAYRETSWTSLDALVVSRAWQ